MDAKELTELYFKSTGKKPTNDMIEFFKSGEEKPLIYKDGKIILPKGGINGSQSNR